MIASKVKSPGVAEIFRMHGQQFRQRFRNQLSVYQERALRELLACRTNILGGHVHQCEGCGHRKQHNNSCCNRICPKCQSSRRKKRNEEQAKLLLPVQYHHIVFTIPDELAQLAVGNEQVFYRALLRATKIAILGVGREHFGLELGLIVVLHTWGQLMFSHGHTHTMLPGGGLTLDEEKRWVSLPQDVALPENLLRVAFQKSFIAHLRAAYRDGKLYLRGDYRALDTGKRFYQFLKQQHDRKWVLHAEVANQRSRKRTRFDQLVEEADGPTSVNEDASQAMKYLTSYASGTVMTDDRIVSISESEVIFTYKDYREGGRVKEKSIDPLEFIRRFLLHVLPQKMRHIRHYGFYAHRFMTDNLKLIRGQLEVADPASSSADEEEADEPDDQNTDGSRGPRCSKCRGKMIAVEIVDRPSVQDILDLPLEVINGATTTPPLRQRELAFGFP